MKIKVSASFSGVLPSGSYANMKPSFSAEVEYDLPDRNCMDSVIEIIDKEQSALHEICYGKFQSVAAMAQVELVKKQKENIRFHDVVIDGVTHQFPSVSSICSYDKTFDMSPEDLQQYASQGTLEDMRCRHFMRTGEWVTDLTKIQGTFTDLAILKKGSLRLQSPTDFSLPSFLAKFPIENLTEGKFTYSLKHKFAGTPDAIGIYEGKRYVIDFKRTPDKSYFKQLAGYAIALEEQGAPAFEGLMLIGVNPDTKQGFSKPMTTMEVEQCKQMFLDARADFKKLFLI